MMSNSSQTKILLAGESRVRASGHEVLRVTSSASNEKAVNKQNQDQKTALSRSSLLCIYLTASSPKDVSAALDWSPDILTVLIYKKLSEESTVLNRPLLPQST